MDYISSLFPSWKESIQERDWVDIQAARSDE